MKTKNLKAMCSVVLASSLIGGSVIYRYERMQRA